MDFLDIGIWEILVVFVVILLVVGPEKLPIYAQKLGKLLRNFRKITSNLTGELMKAADLEEEFTGVKKSADDMKKAVSDEANDLKNALDAEAREITRTIDEETKGARETPQRRSPKPEQGSQRAEQRDKQGSQKHQGNDES